MSPHIAALSFLVPMILATTRHELVEDKVSLRLSLTKDDVISYKASTTVTTCTVLPAEEAGAGENMDITYETAMDVEYRVAAQDADGTLTLDSKILRLRGKMKLSLDEKEREFDSTKPAGDDPLAKKATAVAGKSIQLVLNPEGKVVDVRGMAELMKGVRPEERPEDAEDQAFLESMVETYGGFFAPLPRDPVGVGESWTDESDMAVPGFPLTMKMKMIHQVKAIDAEGVDVTIEGSMAMTSTGAQEPGKEPEQDEPSMKEFLETMKMEATVTGTARISRRDGLAIQQTMALKVTTSMPMPGRKDPMKMSLTMTLTSERVPAGAKK